jgi:hypothetical protein
VVFTFVTDKVFKYNLSGTPLGSWTVAGAGGSPTGITLDPAGGGLCGSSIAGPIASTSSTTRAASPLDRSTLDQLRPRRRQHQPARHRRPACAESRRTARHGPRQDSPPHDEPGRAPRVDQPRPHDEVGASASLSWQSCESVLA